VSWITGSVRPAGLASLDIPVLLDGAQGVGAVGFDAGSLGCAFYAGSGQKWLCGPVGTGMLWISPAWNERLPAPGPTYMNLADGGAGLDALPYATAARHDTPAQSLEATSAAAVAIEILAAAGWDTVHDRAATLASTLASALEDLGRRVVPRDRTTLVSWEDPYPATTCTRLADAGVVIRDLPGTGLLRASVGAWNDDADLDRLLAALEAG
jgi:L-cysteine/cystine lyase